MSERIDISDNRAAIRWKLLTTVSTLALTVYISSADVIRAEDADRPTLWIEVGGQAEMERGVSGTFTAPFMLIDPLPAIYGDNMLITDQHSARFAFGADGKVTFQPEDSDWSLSVGVRYGRSHSDKHVHRQTIARPLFLGTGMTYPKYASPFVDITAPSEEHHTVADFSVGKDIGIGFLGHEGTSTVDFGARFAELTAKTGVNIYARNYTVTNLAAAPPKYVPIPSFYQYTMSAHAARSFKGAGPSLSWNASAVIAGDAQDGELTLDWGINVAVLFGRQKAKTDHATKAMHFDLFQTYLSYNDHYIPMYNRPPHFNTRSRSVTVPNIGGFAGISLKLSNSKISIGYRYDTFLNAMDTGIDAAKKSDLTFDGPYASISIGLGN